MHYAQYTFTSSEPEEHALRNRSGETANDRSPTLVRERGTISPSPGLPIIRV